jgi:hypothetical protein
MLDTLENVKSRIGITTDDYDAFLTRQIVLISDAIEGYCGRKFNEIEYDQTFYRGDYRPTGMLELFHFPVSEIDSITMDDEVIDPEEYRLHKPTGRIILKRGSFFWAEETVIRYTAGYDPVPSPILSVLDSLVQERYNKEISGVALNFGSDVQRVSIPGAISIDFDYTLNNNERKSAFGTILGSSVNSLDPYRSERAVLGEGKMSYVEVVP